MSSIKCPYDVNDADVRGTFFQEILPDCIDALTEKGIPEIWDTVQEYLSLTKENGYFRNKRNRQAKHWMYDTITNIKI